MFSKIVEFLIVNAVYIVPGVLVAALVLSQAVRRGAAMVLRMVARPLLLIAAVALVYDGTRTLAGGSGLVITSLAEHAQSLFPAFLEAAHAATLKRFHPAVWNSGVQSVLHLPSWLVFGVLGFVLAYIGRKRQRVNVFVN